VSELEKNT